MTGSETGWAGRRRNERVAATSLGISLVCIQRAESLACQRVQVDQAKLRAMFDRQCSTAEVGCRGWMPKPYVPDPFLILQRSLQDYVAEGDHSQRLSVQYWRKPRRA